MKERLAGMKRRSLEALEKTGSARVKATKEDNEVMNETGRRVLEAVKTARMGRPKKSHADLRAANMRVRWTLEEQKNLLSYANELGITPSDYVRNAVANAMAQHAKNQSSENKGA